MTIIVAKNNVASASSPACSLSSTFFFVLYYHNVQPSMISFLINLSRLLFTACGAVVKCHTNEMSISLPKSLLVSIDRENLQLLDPNCSATENSTHFVLTTTLIGCGTSSSHTENSLVYSNRVRHVPPVTAVITRTPEVQISFSCHYSKYGFVSTGALRSEKRTKINWAAERDLASDEDICWNNRCDVSACQILSCSHFLRRIARN